MNKLKALLQWFVLLELQQHRHWCHLWEKAGGYNNCEHRSGCWYCKGIFCADIDRKNCPECEKRGCVSDVIVEAEARRAR